MPYQDMKQASSASASTMRGSNADILDKALAASKNSTSNTDNAKAEQYYKMRVEADKRKSQQHDSTMNSIFGKDAMEKRAIGMTNTNPIEGAFQKIGAAIQGGMHVAGVTGLKATELWTSTFNSGIKGMATSVASTISSAITSITGSNLAGQLFNGFASVFIQSAQSAFDWSIQQNQQNIKARAVTGRDGAVKFGDIPGMGLADIAKWGAAAQQGGASGSERTGESYQYKYKKISISSDAIQGAAGTLKSEMSKSISQGLDSSSMAKAGISAAKQIADGMNTEIKTGTHQINVAEKLFQMGTSMGLDSGATGKMFADMKSATGDVNSALHEMGQAFEVTQQAAQRTGISAEVFRTAIMGSSAAARGLNVDMKSVMGTVTMLSKSQKEMGAFGIDLQAQGADITKDLIDRSKMSAAQHANLGMEMSAGMGITPANTMEAWAASRYGSKVANNIQFSGNNMSVAGAGPGAFGGLTSNTNAESLKAMRASLYKETEGMQGAERLYAMQQIAKAKYNVGEAGATALVTAKEGDVGGLAENKEFTNSMKSASELAAQTLTSAQRQEMIQRSLVEIVMNIASIATAGFAQLLRVAISSFGVQAKQSGLGDWLAGTAAKAMGIDTAGIQGTAKSMLNNKALFGLDFAETMGKSSTNIARATSTLVNEVRHQGGASMAAMQSGQAFTVGQMKVDAGLTGYEGAHASRRVAQGMSDHGIKGSNDPVGKYHTGGTFTGISKVLTNEFFTPLSFHGGGVHKGGSGSAFTLDTKALDSNEAFMVANRPMQVQTPAQFSKTQNGSGGSVYHMNFTITGVASKSDIVQTFTAAINQAMG